VEFQGDPDPLGAQRQISHQAIQGRGRLIGAGGLGIEIRDQPTVLADGAAGRPGERLELLRGLDLVPARVRQAQDLDVRLQRHQRLAEAVVQFRRVTGRSASFRLQPPADQQLPASRAGGSRERIVLPVHLFTQT
jgi:hypothetical protein